MKPLILFVFSTLLTLLPLSAFARDTVTLVCEDDFAPYGYKSQQNEAAGFATEVIVAAYKAVGVDVKFKIMPYARCMDLVLEGVEVGCYDTNNDEKSLKNYIFPDEPLFIGEMVLWARNDFDGEMDLERLISSGEVVGVTHGYNYDAPGVSFDYNDQIKKDSAPTVTMTLLKLLANRYNFAAVEKKVALLAIAKNKEELEGKVKIVGEISHPGLYISFSKKHADGQKYSDLFSQGIRIIKQTGQYNYLEKKWNTLIFSGVIP